MDTTTVNILCVCYSLVLSALFLDVGISLTAGGSKLCISLPSIMDFDNHPRYSITYYLLNLSMLLLCWIQFALHVYCMWQGWDGWPGGLLQLPLHVALALLVSLAYLLVAVSCWIRDLNPVVAGFGFILAVECLWLGWRHIDVAFGFLLGMACTSKTIQMKMRQSRLIDVLQLEQDAAKESKERTILKRHSERLKQEKEDLEKATHLQEEYREKVTRQAQEAAAVAEKTKVKTKEIEKVLPVLRGQWIRSDGQRVAGLTMEIGTGRVGATSWRSFHSRAEMCDSREIIEAKDGAKLIIEWPNDGRAELKFDFITGEMLERIMSDGSTRRWRRDLTPASFKTMSAMRGQWIRSRLPPTDAFVQDLTLEIGTKNVGVANFQIFHGADGQWDGYPQCLEQIFEDKIVILWPGPQGGLAEFRFDVMSDTLLESNLNDSTTIRWERAEWAAALKKAEDAAVVAAEKKAAARREAELRIQACKTRRAKAAGPFAGLVIETGTEGELFERVLEMAPIKGKVELELFTQFLHCLCIHVAGMPLPQAFFERVTGFKSLGEFSDDGLYGEELNEFYYEVIGNVVDTLAPDVFRVFDHNNDKFISEEEFVLQINVVEDLMHYSSLLQHYTSDQRSRMVLDLVFVVMDKDSSKTLEIEEVLAFVDKMFGMACNMARTAIKGFGRIALDSLMSEIVNDAFNSFDKDLDGCVRPEEYIKGFGLDMLEAIMVLPHDIQQATKSDTDYKAKDAQTAMTGMQELLTWAKAGGTKGLILDKIKTGLPVIWGMPFRRLLPHPIHYAEKYKGVSEDVLEFSMDFHAHVDAVGAGIQQGLYEGEIKDLADSIFALLDADNDGKVSYADARMYTDFFLEDCSSQEVAKARLLAIFDSLDINGNGVLSKDDLVQYVGKLINVCTSGVLLWVSLLEALVARLSGAYLKQLMDHLKQFRLQAGSTNTTIDSEEFRTLCWGVEKWADDFKPLVCLVQLVERFGAM